MRATLPDLLHNLGVSHTMSSYETYPWSVTDNETGQTCSAEVRMGPDGDDLEAEVQILYDNPPAGEASAQQWMWLRATPHTQDQWIISNLRIKNENWNNTVYEWEGKSVALFRAIINDIQRGMIPDFEELLEREMRASERFADQRGGGSGKSPKIRAAQLLDMKKGQGF